MVSFEIFLHSKFAPSKLKKSRTFRQKLELATLSMILVEGLDLLDRADAHFKGFKWMP